MNEEEILSSLVLLADDTVHFLTDSRKWERECWVCIEFLRALRVNVSETDLIKPNTEPPDVIYQDANFEVFIVLDQGRKLHADWKELSSLYRSAQCMEDLKEPYKPPKKISGAQVIEFLKPTLSIKRNSYAGRGISLGDIDVLVYLNLKECILDLGTPFPELDELQQQGWRSLSVFGNSYCRVLCVQPSAPDFLRAHVGEYYSHCTGIAMYFN
jgi:hypothetical protein